MASCDVGVALGVCVAGAEKSLPVGHGQDTRDGTCVITAIVSLMTTPGENQCDLPVENTTKGDKQADGDSRPCLASLLGLAEGCPSNCVHNEDRHSNKSVQ